MGGVSVWEADIGYRQLREAISEAVGWRGSENFFKALVSYILRYGSECDTRVASGSKFLTLPFRFRAVGISNIYLHGDPSS